MVALRGPDGQEVEVTSAQEVSELRSAGYTLVQPEPLRVTPQQPPPPVDPTPGPGSLGDGG